MSVASGRPKPGGLKSEVQHTPRKLLKVCSCKTSPLVTASSANKSVRPLPSVWSKRWSLQKIAAHLAKLHPSQAAQGASHD